MWYRLSVYVLLAAFQTSAFGLQSFAVTREELAMMPPYCTAMYGSLVGLPGLQDSPLRRTMPPGCPTLHHYCDGLKAMIRVDRNRAESGYWLHEAIESFKARVYGWEQFAPNCSLRAEAHTNLGKALLRQDKTSIGVAVMNFNKALQLKKDYLPAYYALSDVYLNLGKKKEALGVIEEGLKYLPDSNGLLRRFKELGGKIPPVPIAKSNPQLSPQPDKMMGAQQPEPGAAAEKKQVPVASPAHQPPDTAGPGPIPSTSPTATPNKTGGESPVAAPKAAESEPPKIGSPKNPYCRFCPD